MQINKALKQRPHKGGKHIIELKEVIDQKDRKYIVYEYCEYNSLREMLSKRKHAFNKKNIYEIGLQMAEVLKLIHFDLIQD
jgi:serine/threonine protein kinase